MDTTQISNSYSLKRKYNFNESFQHKKKLKKLEEDDLNYHPNEDETEDNEAIKFVEKKRKKQKKTSKNSIKKFLTSPVRGVTPITEESQGKKS